MNRECESLLRFWIDFDPMAAAPSAQELLEWKVGCIWLPRIVRVVFELLSKKTALCALCITGDNQLRKATQNYTMPWCREFYKFVRRVNCEKNLTYGVKPLEIFLGRKVCAIAQGSDIQVQEPYADFAYMGLLMKLRGEHYHQAERMIKQTNIDTFMNA